MEHNNKISAVIITFNEEQNIGRCIESLEGVADEIIVVDSYSTDSTETICKKYGVKFTQQKFLGHIEQKNFAMNLAENTYVLSLDADEALSPELKATILNEKESLKYDSYSFNRLNNYCGKWIKHCGWYPDVKVRLWNKNLGKWGGQNPHDKVIMNPESSIKKLDKDLHHYAFNTISQHIDQIQFFTDISAQAAYNNGKKSNLLLILLKPKLKFFRDYIFKAGFLDGYYGLVICLNSAFAKYLKYLKLYELNKKADINR